MPLVFYGFFCSSLCMLIIVFVQLVCNCLYLGHVKFSCMISVATSYDLNSRGGTVNQFYHIVSTVFIKKKLSVTLTTHSRWICFPLLWKYEMFGNVLDIKINAGYWLEISYSSEYANSSDTWRDAELGWFLIMNQIPQVLLNLDCSNNST